MEYILRPKNIVADAMSRLILDDKQNFTKESNYNIEKLSETYEIEELSEGKFLLSLKLYTIINRNTLEHNLN